MTPTNLTLPEPCHEDWNAMTPTARGRHCAACNITVIDISSMTPSAARQTVHEIETRMKAGEHVCCKAPRDQQGRIRLPEPRRYVLSNGIAAILAMTMAGPLMTAEPSHTSATACAVSATHGTPVQPYFPAPAGGIRALNAPPPNQGGGNAVDPKDQARQQAQAAQEAQAEADRKRRAEGFRSAAAAVVPVEPLHHATKERPGPEDAPDPVPHNHRPNPSSTTTAA